MTRMTIEVTTKAGATVRFECDEFETHGHGYSVKNCDGPGLEPALLYLDPAEVAAVVRTS